MSALTGEWECALHEEFSKEYYKNLFFFIRKQYSETIVYPKADEIFTAFHLTPLEKVKVVILGQDPYHNEHQAHGLCFSVQPGEEVPPSLVNIYQELHASDCLRNLHMQDGFHLPARFGKSSPDSSIWKHPEVFWVCRRALWNPT